MEQKSLLQTLSSIIQELKENGQWGTAHVYQSAYNSFALFSCCRDIPFKKFTPALLKDFEIYLRKRKCSWNTVSTYMKVLRATYNRAVDEGYASYVPRLFRHVQTGVSSERKRSLEASDMGGLMNGKGEELSAGMERTLAILQLMFILRGIPFVDLAYLRKSDIQGNILRIKGRNRLICCRSSPVRKGARRLTVNTSVRCGVSTGSSPRSGNGSAVRRPSAPTRYGIHGLPWPTTAKYIPASSPRRWDTPP